jgi:hypothetical protein
MIINPALPSGTVTFCDDVRFELNGKSTLVGVYGDELRLFGEPPLMLSELHAVVSFHIAPSQTPARGTIKIIKSGSENVICEQDFEFRDLNHIERRPLLHSEDNALEYTGLNVHFMIKDLLIDEQCRLKVRAFMNYDEVRIGSLHISFAPTSDMQLPS